MPGTQNQARAFLAAQGVKIDPDHNVYDANQVLRVVDDLLGRAAAAPLAAVGAPAASVILLPAARLTEIREFHEDCVKSVTERDDKDYILAANYAPEYMQAVADLLATQEAHDGWCVNCAAPKVKLPGQYWGSCTNDVCPAYQEDSANVSYIQPHEKLALAEARLAAAEAGPAAAPVSLVTPQGGAAGEYAELVDALDRSIKAFEAYEARSSSVALIEASDEADIALAEVARETLPGLLARLHELEAIAQLHAGCKFDRAAPAAGAPPVGGAGGESGQSRDDSAALVWNKQELCQYAHHDSQFVEWPVDITTGFNTKAAIDAYAATLSGTAAAPSLLGGGAAKIELPLTVAPSVAPPFSANKNKGREGYFQWWAWHPCYPWWSQSDWRGLTLEEAKAKRENPLFSRDNSHWKLIFKHGENFFEIEDHPAPAEHVATWQDALDFKNGVAPTQVAIEGSGSHD